MDPTMNLLYKQATDEVQRLTDLLRVNVNDNLPVFLQFVCKALKDNSIKDWEGALQEIQKRGWSVALERDKAIAQYFTMSKGRVWEGDDAMMF